MSHPALLLLSQRLTSTSSLLLERSRVISLNLPPSASSQNQIVRNLTGIKGELDKLEREFGASTPTPESASTSRSAGSAGRKGKENDTQRQLREAGEQYDRLVQMFGEDEVGREKAKSLRREPKRSTTASTPTQSLAPTPQPPQTSQFGIPSASASASNASRNSSTVPPISTNASASASRVPKVEIEPPTPLTNPNLPFRDYPDGRPSTEVDGQRTQSGNGGFKPYTIDDPEEEEAGLGERDILDGQQMLMQDQDERLNLLSHSIGRQNHLSIQIGTELDHHHELLEDVDGAMDRTASRLGSARRRLDKVAHDAKQHGSTVTIVVLIVILLLLIIVFKT